MDNNSEKREHRTLGLSALGILFAVIGGFFAYQGYIFQSSQTAAISPAYQYTIKQSANSSIIYAESSFFGGNPGPDNNAYVSDLTKEVAAKFHYEYTGSTPAELTTTYSVKAEVKANYALQGDSEANSTVWKQEYLLVKPTVEHTSGNSISLDKTVTIPYADYKKAANEFRTTLALPTSSQTVATFTVRTTGTIDGTPFEDMRVSTVAVPLEEQIYQPTIKYDKEDSKQVVTANAQQGKDRTVKLQLFGGAALGLAGLVLTAFGMRKRIFKSAHQRELDKIFRLHDGIIVRTSRPIDLTDHNIVPMRSFDDMLNLEEELKSPIIADEISSTLTYFLIAHNNVMYLYKLGDTEDRNRTNRAIAASTTSQALAAAQHPRVARETLQPVTTRKPITVTQSDEEWGEIIKELDAKPIKKPTHHKKKVQ